MTELQILGCVPASCHRRAPPSASLCRSQSALAWLRARAAGTTAPCVHWLSPSAIERFERKRLGDLALPPVAVQDQELSSGVLLAKFEDRTLDNGVGPRARDLPRARAAPVAKVFATIQRHCARRGAKGKTFRGLKAGLGTQPRA